MYRIKQYFLEISPSPSPHELPGIYSSIMHQVFAGDYCGAWLCLSKKKTYTVGQKCAYHFFVDKPMTSRGIQKKQHFQTRKTVFDGLGLRRPVIKKKNRQKGVPLL